MTVTSSLHTAHSKWPLEVKLTHWPVPKSPTLAYASLEIGQLGEGDITVYIRHSMYGDLITKLEDAARQLRDVVAKEMVATWGFPQAIFECREDD